MNKNKTLMKEAIADAKVLKAAAIANAKLSLEETFAPRIQSMLSNKLNEEAEELEEVDELDENQSLDENEELEENEFSEFETDEFGSDEFGSDNLDDEFNLDEILAELESEEGLDEAKKKDDKKDEKKDDKKPSKKEPKEPKEDKVEDLSMEDLKGLIKDIVADVVGGGEEAEDMEGMDDMGGQDGFEVDEFETDGGMGSEDEINLDELLAEMEADELDENKSLDESEELEEVKEELDEAIKTIKFLKKELNETHLLNSKLLYANKIFKSKNLNNVQKSRVIESLDKATTIKEAKLVYNALTESITTNKKSTIKRSLKEGVMGFASKPTGGMINNRKNEQTQVVDANVTRWQKLAGLL